MFICRKSGLKNDFGNDFALEAYGIEGFDTVQEYLQAMVEDHVAVLVRELVIAYSMAKEMNVIDDLYKRYDDTVKNYMKQNEFSTRREALETLAANGDEACIFYSNFLSPVLGLKLSERVQGLNFADFIKDCYLEY